MTMKLVIFANIAVCSPRCDDEYFVYKSAPILTYRAPTDLDAVTVHTSRHTNLHSNSFY